MQRGNELNLKLFIEGRSVPVAGAQCTFRTGAPSTATINLVPLREINDILPRTMVHLFVRDMTYPGLDKPWVLLFEGEVYGFAMGKQTSNRSFDIYCMDISNYWDNAKQYYMNQRTSFADTTQTFVSSRNAAEAKKEDTQVIPTTTGIKAYLVNLINQKLQAGKDLLEAVLEILKGVEEVNPFFRYANARYRINDRIIFQSAGNIKEIFDFENSDNLFEAIGGKGNGGLVTIRQVVNLLMSYIFHDFTSIPCPSKTGQVKEGIGKTNQTIGSFLFKPSNFMLPPPKCNVLYPDHYEGFNYPRNFFNEVTRTKFQPRMTAAELQAAKPEAFNPFVYAPSGYNYFRTGNEGEVKGKQYENAGTSGRYGDTAELKNTSKLQDYNFMSYEEVLKGIFSDLDNVVPSAHILSKIAKYGGQQTFFQRAADHLFFKKRLASRRTSARGGLNLAPVPGFNILLLDNSDAEQHVLGTLESVTHTISATGGATTSYEIGYARYIEEKDLWEGTVSEPPIPPWYDPTIFGSRRQVNSSDYENLPKSQQSRIKDLGFINDFGNSGIKNYFLGLLGNTDANTHLGSEPVTSTKFPNMVAATLNLVQQYRNAKDADLGKFLSKQTRRDYVTITEVFQFLGATIPASQKNASTHDYLDITFKGGVFDGGFVNRASDTENSRDKELKTLFGTEATSKRRKVIDAYRKRLLTERGFRG